MNRLIASFVLALLACVGAWGMFAVAIVEDHWFESSVTEFSTRVGLTEMCTNNDCEPHDFSADINQQQCTISGSQFQFRFDGIRYALVIAGGFSVFAALLNVIAICTEATKVLYLGQFCMSLAFVAAALAVSYFWNSMEAWMFCDVSYCTWYWSVYGAGRPCQYWYGFSFALSAGGVVLFLLSILWSGFTLVAASRSRYDHSDSDSDSDSEQIDGSRDDGDVAVDPSDSDANQKQEEQQQEAPTTVITPTADAIGGDDTEQEEEAYGSRPDDSGSAGGAAAGGGEEAGWYEEEQNDGTMAWIPNGYYWEDESELYYSDESTFYYDPASNQYYDGVKWFDM